MDQHVNVECFGILQQVCGGPERTVRVTTLPATVADILASLAQEVPAARAYLPHTACAIGDEIVKRDARLQPGDTLVLLPPVSGG